MTSKQLALGFCCILIVPIILLVIGAMVHVAMEEPFETSTLGKLVN